MTNEQIKQAYVVGKAAKGIIRYREFQKQAMMKRAGTEEGAPTKPAKPDNGSFLGGYGVPVGVGAGTGAILGALIQAARGKSILNGLLVGGGIGGLGGAGYQAMGGIEGAKQALGLQDQTA